MHRPFLLALALAAVTGCSRPDATAPAAARPAIAVSTAPVRVVTQPQVRPVAGVVRPHDRALVAARVMGTVEAARLAVGQVVQASEVLVQIRATELGARLEQARAALAQAERDHARETALEAKGAAAAETVRATADRLRLARAAVAEAEALAGYATIRAPFAGVITEDLINAGDLAAPGQPLFTVEGSTNLRAEVPVPESLATLPVGTAVGLQLDETTLEGRLVELSPSADPTSRTRLAKIALPDGSAARSGQFIRALWPTGEATVLSVPATAVQAFGQMKRVYVAIDGRAQLRLVRTGAQSGDTIQILSGLDAGEAVVVAPPTQLRDGQPLQLQP
ncbi:MAG: efflux RND transporter periplasmic adaptor subunit [Cephaloticoccus sp.]